MHPLFWMASVVCTERYLRCVEAASRQFCGGIIVSLNTSKFYQSDVRNKINSTSHDF
jgi:hypothetical protein